MTSFRSLKVMILSLFLAMIFIFGCLPQDGLNSDFEMNSNDPYEPDNSPVKAEEIKNGEEQVHSIYDESGVYDIDYVKFEAKSGGIYRIALSNIKGFEPEVTLYGEDGSEVIEMKNPDTYTGKFDWWGYDSNHNFSAYEKESIVFEPKEDGTYYVSIKDKYGCNDSGKYKIKLSEIIEIAPTKIEVETVYTDFGINIKWESISGGIEGYQIYRSKSDEVIDEDNIDYSKFELIDTLLVSENQYIDKRIEHDKEYFYFIRGYASNKLGVPSNIGKATFYWELFIPPKDLIEASENFDDKIEVTLKDKIEYDKIIRYDLYRTTEPNEENTNLKKIGSFEESQHFNPIVDEIDKSNADVKQYYYCIKIVIKSGGQEITSKKSLFTMGKIK